MKLFRKMERLPPWLTWGAVGLLRGWSATLRVQVRDEGQYLVANPVPPTIFLLWHNRMLCMPPLVPPAMKPYLAFLASRSRDGGYISDLLQRFGLSAVRGSSSRGGAAALRELREHLEGGRSLLITPDGPRGPCYAVQEGPLWLASATGCPIVPAILNTRWHVELKSWDRFQVPLPGSRAELVLGAPLRVPPDLGPAELEEWRTRVRRHLLSVTRWDHRPLPPDTTPAAPGGP